MASAITCSTVPAPSSTRTTGVSTRASSRPTLTGRPRLKGHSAGTLSPLWARPLDGAASGQTYNSGLLYKEPSAPSCRLCCPGAAPRRYEPTTATPPPSVRATLVSSPCCGIGRGAVTTSGYAAVAGRKGTRARCAVGHETAISSTTISAGVQTPVYSTATTLSR